MMMIVMTTEVVEVVDAFLALCLIFKTNNRKVGWTIFNPDYYQSPQCSFPNDHQILNIFNGKDDLKFTVFFQFLYFIPLADNKKL